MSVILPDLNTMPVYELTALPAKELMALIQMIFDRSEGAPIEARQVLPLTLTNPDGSDFYAAVIRLLTVAPGQ